MVGQFVHVAVIEGQATLPWMVCGLCALADGVTRAPSWREMWRRSRVTLWLLTGLWAWVFLTGEPRAIADLELVALIVSGVLVVHHWRESWRAALSFLSISLVAVIAGALMSLIQLLPGWDFIGLSQRSAISYTFYGSGSLSLKWSPLLALPEFFGGNGSGITSGYFANYNLPEVTGYVGICGLVALAAAFVSLRRSAGRERIVLAVVSVMAVVGLFATWGMNTPLGHIFHALPLFGSTRLQSRSVIVVDLAGSLALAWWLDARERHGAPRALRAVALTSAVVASLALATAAFPAAVTSFCLDTPVYGWQVGGLRVTMAAHALIAILVGVSAWRQWSFRRVITLLVVDQIFFIAIGLSSFAAPISPVPDRAVSQATLGTTGRFALIDPLMYDLPYLESVGVPNMNIFTGLESVSGYGSLIGRQYGDATGVHTFGWLDPCSFNSGRFEQLRLTSLVIDGYVLRQPVTEPIDLPNCLRSEPDNRITRFVGGSVPVNSVDLITVAGHRPNYRRLRLDLIGDRGQIVGRDLRVWGPHITFAARAVSALRLRSTDGSLIWLADERFRNASTGSIFSLTTPLQLAVSQSDNWSMSSASSRFTFLRSAPINPVVWVAGQPAAIRSYHEELWGDATVTVHLIRPGLLVRSVSNLPGWRVSAVDLDTGHRIALQVTAHDLVQSVALPAGSYRLSFHYHAPYIVTGLVVSSVASLLYLGGGLWLWRRREVASES
jgi:hypothetical protein